MAQTPAHGAAKPLSPALDTTFKVGLVLKGLDGILEVAGGILLLFLSPQAIQHLVRVLTAHELSEDPHDLIARYLLHTTAHLSHGTSGRRNGPGDPGVDTLGWQCSGGCCGGARTRRSGCGLANGFANETLRNGGDAVERRRRPESHFGRPSET